LQSSHCSIALSKSVTSMLAPVISVIVVFIVLHFFRCIPAIGVILTPKGKYTG
jgi:hypothetical protein